jgi:hypothetical protein
VDISTVNLTDFVGVSGLILAVISIILFVIDEFERRPCIEFLEYKDEPTANNLAMKEMWYHIKVRNKKPFCFFNRDAALGCIARVTFVDKTTGKQLAPQITCHWTSQPAPLDYTSGRFDPSKVPTCQRIDVGFREEMFDILIKYQGQRSFVAADPWIVYDSQAPQSMKQSLTIQVNECIVRVEIEAINLGKLRVAEYTLKNKGQNIQDIEITRNGKN